MGGSGLSYHASLRSLTADFGLAPADVPRPPLGGHRR
jgi:hypothetical protein